MKKQVPISLTDLHPSPQPGMFSWAAFFAGIAGVVFFGILPERYTDFDWRIPSLLVGVPFWFSFDQQLVGLRRRLFRMSTPRVWIGRAILACGLVQVVLARRILEDFVTACLVMVSTYLMVWAAVGPQHLFSAVGWRLITSPRQWGSNLVALLSGKPLPMRKPALTAHRWSRELYGICKDIGMWRDPFALRSR